MIKNNLNDKKLENYLDKNFKKLIQIEEWLHPDKFFNKKWELFEEIPICHRSSHISFLNKFSQTERDLYLLKYSLRHLKTLIDYFCQTSSLKKTKNTLLNLAITDWDMYPKNPLRFSFFIAYESHKLFVPAKPFALPYTEQSAYIISLLKKLNLSDDYFVYDDLPPIDKELQRVHVGLKQHPCPELVTLDHFAQDKV